jgi:hypothetical protein
MTDQNGYIFDAAGQLLGVLKSLPAERMPAPPTVAPGLSPNTTPAAADRKAQLEQEIADLNQQIATLKANGHAPGIPSRLAQLQRR